MRDAELLEQIQAGDAAAMNAAEARASAEPDRTAAMARVLVERGRRLEARRLLMPLLAAHPWHAAAWVAMAEAQRSVDRIGESLEAWWRATQSDPGLAEAHFGFAALLAYVGDSDLALVSFRRALELMPDSPQVHSSYLVAMQYTSGVGREDIAAEHRRWAAKFAPSLPPRPELRDPDPERRLRIGLVSGDFRFHALEHFFLEPLRQRSRDRWEAICYSNTPVTDNSTGAFQSAADAWRDVTALDDDEMFDLIRADGIDLLVDLNGQTGGNRLPVFAKRAAPVQVSWMDYVHSTGLAAMDALIVDRHLVTPEDEPLYAEPIFRLPDDAICFYPLPYLPAVTPPPHRRRGHVTFGCFNMPQKIGPAAVAAWARVLHRVPGSRILLKASEFRHAWVQNRYRRLFAGHGIGMERLEFQGGGAHPDFVAGYGGVDIALDPFPYSGGLNTCEALWMGVPVITFAGDRQGSRLAASHLHNAGLPELVAPDLETAIDLAVSLAGEPDRLKAYREELRPTLAASPLCDVPRFIRNFEAILRDLWRKACTS